MVGAEKSAIASGVMCYLVLAMAIVTAFLDHADALSCALQVTIPVLKSPSSSPLDEATAGEQFVITTIISNHCIAQDVPFFAIVEVRDSDGITESLNWQSGVLKGLDYQTEVGASWVPLHGGDYELRTFILSNIENPQILSPVMTQNITIAANSDRAVAAE